MGTYESDRGAGWVLFAGVMVMIAGFLNVIYGIAAIDESSTFVEGNRFVLFDDLNTWGWIHTLIGVAQLVAAFSIWGGNEFGRWIGIFTASVSAIAVLLFVNAFPIAALGIFILDLLVIYGLVAYGGRRSA